MGVIDRQLAIDAIDRERKTKHLFNTAEDGLLEARRVINTLPDADPERNWILVEEKMPDAEVLVWISCKQEYRGGKKPYFFVAYGFYEDGKVSEYESCYAWDDYENLKYDSEKDDYYIPEGWFEACLFADQFAAIDCQVLAWMPLPEPYRCGADMMTGGNDVRT